MSTVLGKLALRADEVPTSIWLLLAAASIAVFIKVFYRPSLPKNAPKWYKGHDWPLMGALRFYSARADYMKEAAKHTSTGNFSFYVGKKQVVGLSGEDARRAYFDDRELDFGGGFAELLTGTPSAAADMDNFGKWFSKVLTHMIKRDALYNNLPALVNDTRTMFESLGKAEPCAANPEWRTFDPFNQLFRTIYQLTMRTVGAEEIAEDPDMLEDTLEHFTTFESLSSTAHVVFPWLPTPRHIKRLYKGARLAMVFQRIIEKRKATGKRREDAVQYLLDSNTSFQNIIAFVIGALFAGILNSGINAGWLPIFLAQNKEWYNRVQEEVDAVVAKKRTSPRQTPADVLGTLTIDEWESEFPMADLSLRECIRFTVPGASFRKNISGHDIEIAGSKGEFIPNGSFAAYLLEDAHFNPSIYSDMHSYDPGRFLEGRAEDKKVAHGFLGWGAGRHPCLGMRFAKLENSLLLAYMVAMYDFELAADEQGNPTSEPAPKPNRQFNTAQKPEETVWLRYKPRKDVVGA